MQTLHQNAAVVTFVTESAPQNLDFAAAVTPVTRVPFRSSTTSLSKAIKLGHLPGFHLHGSAGDVTDVEESSVPSLPAGDRDYCIERQPLEEQLQAAQQCTEDLETEPVCL